MEETNMTAEAFYVGVSLIRKQAGGAFRLLESAETLGPGFIYLWGLFKSWEPGRNFLNK